MKQDRLKVVALYENMNRKLNTDALLFIVIINQLSLSVNFNTGCNLSNN